MTATTTRAGTRAAPDLGPSPDLSRFPATMGPADAVLWDIEKDPVLRSTITAVALLDRSPDWHRLRARLERASRLVPRLRQRVVVPALRAGPPRWVVDPHFDLDYHLRRVRAPEPGDLDSVLAIAAPLAMQSFDRARPLWEFTLVEGLEGGGAALIQKLHHSLTDGVGGIELALLMLDDTRDPPADEPLPPAPRPGDIHPFAALRDAAAESAATGASLLAALPGVVARTAGRALTHPVAAVGDAVTLAGSVGRILAPVPESASPLLTERSLDRRFATLEAPLGELKDAAHAAGGTLNDAFLAVVIGGLRRYHQRLGTDVAELRVTMPINLRAADDVLGGNRFAPARFACPADLDDPGERMRRLGAEARRWRHEPALAVTDVVAGVLDRLPVAVTTSIFGAMLKHVDAVATNVPGIPQQAYLAGAEVVREYAFAPPSGSAVSVALLSHLDTACLGLVMDGAAVVEPDSLVACLAEALDEVLAVGAPDDDVLAVRAPDGADPQEGTP